jgi:hypothetical protein
MIVCVDNSLEWKLVNKIIDDVSAKHNFNELFLSIPMKETEEYVQLKKYRSGGALTKDWLYLKNLCLAIRNLQKVPRSVVKFKSNKFYLIDGATRLGIRRCLNLPLECFLLNATSYRTYLATSSPLSATSSPLAATSAADQAAKVSLLPQ